MGSGVWRWQINSECSTSLLPSRLCVLRFWSIEPEKWVELNSGKVCEIKMELRCDALTVGRCQGMTPEECWQAASGFWWFEERTLPPASALVSTWLHHLLPRRMHLACCFLFHSSGASFHNTGPHVFVPYNLLYFLPWLALACQSPWM